MLERVRHALRSVERGEESVGVRRPFRITALHAGPVGAKKPRGTLHVAFDSADDSGIVTDETDTRHNEM
jgi:hypothetical protein